MINGPANLTAILAGRRPQRRPVFSRASFHSAMPSKPTLTTRQFADSLGVSESSVKRWVDDGAIGAERTAGGHRRIPLAAAVRFVRARRADVPNPKALDAAAPPLLAPADENAAEALFEAALHDHADRVRAIITGCFLAGAPAAAIGDDLLRPAFTRLGTLWRNHADGILLEHRAVQTCLQVLAELRAWLPEPPASAPTAITAAGPADPYLLPPILASLTLLEQGFNALNLGPTTPLETIARAARRYKARLCTVSVSVAVPGAERSSWLALAQSIERQARPSCALLLGGRAAESLPASISGRSHHCESMGHLAAYAAGLLR